MGKEKKIQKYYIYIDMKIDGKVVRKMKFDKECTLEDAKKHYDKWKFIREKWNSQEIIGVILASDDGKIWHKVYSRYEEEKVELENI